MKRFKHVNAEVLEEATSILKEYGGKARIISGGTDLLGQMKDDILPEYPEVIVNIKAITDLDYIKKEAKTLRIGALTRLEDIAKSKLVKEDFATLAEAAHGTASPHIREMGTIAGNICQSNRCWYYWVPNNRFYCMRKGGGSCYALIGDGRYHSIFGGTRVNGTPCSTNCPTNVDIPLYMSKIREGSLAEAAKILINSNPFPAITGRVCPHFCESNCNRGDYDESVSIRCVERFIGDFILNNAGEVYKSPQKEIKKRVAILGSGPSGLSAAYYLRQLGYSVTIFENMDAPGGLLIYGIPPYRLPKDIVKKQIKALENMGIQMKLNAKVGKEIKVNNLLKSFDAVYVACGAWKERPSGIKGEALMMSGAEFLRKLNLGLKEVPGEKAAVIGGGNVAIDVARTLLRLGCEPVIIYRRSKAEMPALKEEVDKTEQENIEIQFLTSPVEAFKKGSKVVLKCSKMELGPLDKTGRARPIPIKGSEFTIEFDAVIRATGEEPDVSIIPTEFLDEKGQLRINPSTYSLGKNIFAGGDFVTGPSTVVAAIAAGRKAASSIHQFLGGAKIQCEGNDCERAKWPQKFNSAYLKKTNRENAQELPVAERVKSLNVEEAGSLDSSAVTIEANRCFNCGCVAVNSSDVAPTLIALNAKIRTTKRVIEAEKFFTVEGDKTTVLEYDEIVTEIEVPKPSSNVKSKFIKFALRKAIDFPIVNCAAAIESDNGIVKAARICLNSVYNQPYRASKAEQYIIGKLIDETSAEDASNVAVADAFPLINNRYKIQIAKTLVKRAILACNSRC